MQNLQKVKDHLNVEYKTFEEMCKAYGRDKKQVMQRLKDNYTLQ